MQKPSSPARGLLGGEEGFHCLNIQMALVQIIMVTAASHRPNHVILASYCLLKIFFNRQVWIGGVFIPVPQIHRSFFTQRIAHYCDLVADGFEGGYAS